MQSKLEIIQHKIQPLEHLARLVRQWKMLSRKVVFTNGCFDILHRGHLTYLLQAADRGHHLVVGLNTDASVRRLKGEGRPVTDEYSRALNLAAQTYIDAVILFDEETPLTLIQTLQPDVLVKGGDYTEATVVGADVVKRYGGQVEILPLVEGYSTTSFLEKLSIRS